MQGPARQKKIDEICALLGTFAYSLSEFRIRQAMKEARALLGSGNSEDAAYVYQALGHGHARLQQHLEAYENHLKALRLDGNEPSFRNNVACALLELGRVNEALGEWLEALDLEQAPSSKLIIFGNIAEAFGVLGQPDLASEALANGLELLAHADPNARFLFARQAAGLGEDDVALELVAGVLCETEGVGRGDRLAIKVIAEAREEVRDKFIFTPGLLSAIQRAAAFPDLAALPRVPRAPQAEKSFDAKRVFDDFREARCRATAAAMSDS